jgi:hypothetical protein
MSSGYPSGLTVGAFEMLLHYFYTPVDVEGALDDKSQNYRAIKELQAAQLIDLCRSEYGSWELTERGMVLGRHIMSLPLPEPQWLMPCSAHPTEASKP